MTTARLVGVPPPSSSLVTGQGYECRRRFPAFPPPQRGLFPSPLFPNPRVSPKWGHGLFNPRLGVSFCLHRKLDFCFFFFLTAQAHMASRSAFSAFFFFFSLLSTYLSLPTPRLRFRQDLWLLSGYCVRVSTNDCYQVFSSFTDSHTRPFFPIRPTILLRVGCLVATPPVAIRSPVALFPCSLSFSPVLVFCFLQPSLPLLGAGPPPLTLILTSFSSGCLLFSPPLDARKVRFFSSLYRKISAFDFFVPFSQ